MKIKRLKPLFLIFTFCAIAGVLVCLWFEYDSRKALQSAREGLVEAGAAMTIEAALPALIPAGSNADSLYTELADYQDAHPELAATMDELEAVGVDRIKVFQLDPAEWTRVESVLQEPVVGRYFDQIARLAERKLPICLGST